MSGAVIQMSYEEEDFLPLSGIQHFAFCRRQWALIHIERQWAENQRTAEGRLLHDRAHDPSASEKRGDVITARGMAVRSAALGASGECDVVEFHRDDGGIPIFGREGKYRVCPVEYKRGRPKQDDVDILQLAAQAMCLEEMLCCRIDVGYLYYGEPRRRTEVEFADELRAKVAAMFDEMHRLYERGHTPKVRRTKSCNACSLKDLCLPVLCGNKSARAYIESHMAEGIEGAEP